MSLDGEELSVDSDALLTVAVLLSFAVFDEEVVVSADSASGPPAEGLEVALADAEGDVVLSDVSSLASPEVGADEDAVSEAVAIAVAVDAVESLAVAAESPSEAADVPVAVSDDVEDEDEAGGSSEGMALSVMPAASARTSLRAAAAPLWLE